MQYAKCKGEYSLIHRIILHLTKLGGRQHGSNFIPLPITIILLLNIFGILLFGCGPMQNKNTTPVDKSLATVPAWAKEAI
jgi:hypothetical protein